MTFLSARITVMRTSMLFCHFLCFSVQHQRQLQWRNLPYFPPRIVRLFSVGFYSAYFRAYVLIRGDRLSVFLFIIAKPFDVTYWKPFTNPLSPPQTHAHICVNDQEIFSCVFFLAVRLVRLQMMKEYFIRTKHIDSVCRSQHAFHVFIAVACITACSRALCVPSAASTSGKPTDKLRIVRLFRFLCNPLFSIRKLCLFMWKVRRLSLCVSIKLDVLPITWHIFNFSA